MKKRESYILGWLYGRIARTMPDYDTAAKMQLAAMRPLTGFAAVHQAAIAAGTLTEDVRQAITSATDELSDAVVYGAEEPVIPLDQQGSWQMGYYCAKAGHPIPPTELDIRSLRKAAGMTQQQLADIIGVTQTMVARWEAGRAKPSAKNAKKIREMLQTGRVD